MTYAGHLHTTHYQKYIMYIFIHYQLLYNSMLQLNGAKSEATKLKWLAYGLLAVLYWLPMVSWQSCADTLSSYVIS